MWADGFGNWHALIPEDTARPVVDARELIHAELVEREPRNNTWVHSGQYVREHVSRAPEQSRPGFIEFLES